MKQELVKPVVLEDAACEVQNEAVIAYVSNQECGWGLTCGSEW